MAARKVFLLMMLLTTMSAVFAAVSILPLEPNANYPNQCLDPKTNKAYAVDSNWDIPGQCQSGACQRSPTGNNLQIQYESCGAQAAPQPPCKVEQNRMAKYPDCCPKIVCP